MANSNKKKKNQKKKKKAADKTRDVSAPKTVFKGGKIGRLSFGSVLAVSLLLPGALFADKTYAMGISPCVP